MVHEYAYFYEYIWKSVYYSSYFRDNFQTRSAQACSAMQTANHNHKEIVLRNAFLLLCNDFFHLSCMRRPYVKTDFGPTLAEIYEHLLKFAGKRMEKEEKIYENYIIKNIITCNVDDGSYAIVR